MKTDAAYDPGEARDPHGQWTAGGGGAAVAFSRGARVSVKPEHHAGYPGLELKGKVGTIATSLQRAEGYLHFVKFDQPIKGTRTGEAFPAAHLEPAGSMRPPGLKNEQERMRAALARDNMQDAAPPRGRDPTRTGMLRQAFRAAGELRLRQFRARLRQAIIDFHMLGGHPDMPMVVPSKHQLQQFNGWLQWEATKTLVDDWYMPWIKQAFATGAQRASKEMKTRAFTDDRDRLGHLLFLGKQELEGIAAAAIQQVTREAAAAVRKKPVEIFRQAAQPLAKIAERLHLFTQVMAMKTFNNAKLEVYRSAGLTHVGITPETQPRGTAKKQLRRRYAVDADGDDYNPDVLPEVEQYDPYPKENAEGDDVVGVITFGDDDVCFECEAIADEGPYTIDEAQDLIPAHPRCRCSTFPWWDQRFTGDAA